MVTLSSMHFAAEWWTHQTLFLNERMMSMQLVL